MLEPFCLSTLTTSHWFCFYVPEYNKLRVHLYRNCDESARLIERYYGHLFLEGGGHLSRMEDICFFRDNTLFMGSVSHENICGIYPPDSSFEQEVRDICDCEKEEDDVGEQH